MLMPVSCLEEQGSNHSKGPWEKQPSRWKETGEGRGTEGDQPPCGS